MIDLIKEQALNLYERSLSNGFWAWPAALLIAIASTFMVRFILHRVAVRIRRFAKTTSTCWDDSLANLFDGLKTPVLFIWIFYFLVKTAKTHPEVEKSLLVAVVIVTIFQIALWGLTIIQTWQKLVLNPKIEKDPSSAAALGILNTTIQMAFISTLVLIGLSNLGINISALLTGLGIGGIAVALAAQNVLGDLLASLSIVLDKPFIIGDFIVSGSEKGTVEHIGIKTTRLRSLSGEELILPNKGLLESRVQNFKRMWKRRVIQRFGVIYSTPVQKVERIPDWVKEIVNRYPNLQFDRCHFAGFGASSLDFELVFFVSDPEYNVFMDLQQAVLLEILKKFSTERVEFAFPTQTIYVEKLAPSQH